MILSGSGRWARSSSCTTSGSTNRCRSGENGYRCGYGASTRPWAGTAVARRAGREEGCVPRTCPTWATWRLMRSSTPWTSWRNCSSPSCHDFWCGCIGTAVKQHFQTVFFSFSFCKKKDFSEYVPSIRMDFYLFYIHFIYLLFIYDIWRSWLPYTIVYALLFNKWCWRPLAKLLISTNYSKRIKKSDQQCCLWLYVILDIFIWLYNRQL